MLNQDFDDLRKSVENIKKQLQSGNSFDQFQEKSAFVRNVDLKYLLQFLNGNIPKHANNGNIFQKYHFLAAK